MSRSIFNLKKNKNAEHLFPVGNKTFNRLQESFYKKRFLLIVKKKYNDKQC